MSDGVLRLKLDAAGDPRRNRLVAPALAEEDDAVDVGRLLRRFEEDLKAADQRGLGVVGGAGGGQGLTGLDQDPLLLAVEHGREELVLGGEAVVDDRLGDARGRGDRSPSKCPRSRFR